MTVDVVIVTYNRIEKLQKALSAYDKQTQLFRSLIVVNNNSTDGTADYLAKWNETPSPYKKYVINLPENKGGAGGFYEGQTFALSLNPDWIYVSDDDAYPAIDMFEQFYSFCKKVETKTTAAICAIVKNMDNTIAYSHRGKIIMKKRIKMQRTDITKQEYQKETVRIDFLSYVGSFINSQAIKEVGICDPRFFIFYDDSEHSLRLTKFGPMFCCSNIIIHHDNASLKDYSDKRVLVTWTRYYHCRNHIQMLKRHFFFSAIYETLRYLYEGLSLTIKSYKNYPVLILTIIPLFDAWTNRLGMHKKYKPGFIIHKT